MADVGRGGWETFVSSINMSASMRIWRRVCILWRFDDDDDDDDEKEREWRNFCKAVSGSGRLEIGLGNLGNRLKHLSSTSSTLGWSHWSSWRWSMIITCGCVWRGWRQVGRHSRAVLPHLIGREKSEFKLLRWTKSQLLDSLHKKT